MCLHIREGYGIMREVEETQENEDSEWRNWAWGILNQWLPALGLAQELEVSLSFVDELLTDGISTEVVSDAPYTAPIIRIRNEYGRIATYNGIEKSLLHECMHILLSNIDGLILDYLGKGKVYQELDTLSERLVVRLTNALLSAKYGEEDRLVPHIVEDYFLND